MMRITETANLNTENIDLMSVEEILNLMNIEDHFPAVAVRRVLPDIARVVNFIVNNFPRGGRMLYVGAGTSGRLAFMDAAECPPTFGIDPARVSVIMAGGQQAVFRASEGKEDDANEGARQVSAWNPTKADCVIGLAASGTTPFVRAGLARAQEAGAFTALVCANPVDTNGVDQLIACVTGPEALTGSTRLKAGTAAKMIINMISTASMLKLGRVYSNRMCYIKSANDKLSGRSVQTVREVLGLTAPEAEALLRASEGELATALTSGLSGADAACARKALFENGGRVRDAVRALNETRGGRA